jgi:3-oxoacyl-[acyl-carrier protein] reductase
MNKKLEGKVALVSGSGRGIGREIALKLAGEGARVVINDLDAEPAQQTVADIVAAGGQAVACAGSVTDAAFADRFVGKALESYGGLDIIVNNAGYTWDNVVQKMTDEQWEAMLAVHLTAPFRILRAASHYIREANKREAAEGRDVFRKVVNISSTSGVYGNAGQANYAAAKAGMIGMSKALAAELASRSITVNCVAPGFIETAMTDALTEDQKARILPAVPMGKLGTGADIAGAVVYLASDEAGYVTGQTIHVNGGMAMI